MLFEYLTHQAAVIYELVGVFLAFALFVFIGALAIARFEDTTIEDALYFAAVTAFTVGFGDITPKTRGARLITVLLAFMGLLLIGLVVSVAGEAFERTMLNR